MCDPNMLLAGIGIGIAIAAVIFLAVLFLD